MDNVIKIFGDGKAGRYVLSTLRALRPNQKYGNNETGEVTCELFILEEGILFASNGKQILIPIKDFIDKFVNEAYKQPTDTKQDEQE